jgi:YfiH family protein
MLNLTEKNNLKLLKAPGLEKLGWLEHAFTTRVGGVSTGPYHSFNLFGREEEAGNALANRKKLGETLGFASEKLVRAGQVHGKRVQIVTEPGLSPVPETDALVTNVPGIPLMLLYADCLPVLVVDPENKAVGVIHAGWKGTAQSILTETLEVMSRQYGSRKADFLIAIGIGIARCCFEIGPEVKEKLSLVSFSENVFETRDKKIYADLLEINKSQAVNYGVPEENIAYNRDLCTFCNQDLFYSYRRDNKITGRQGAVIIRKPEG